ncbi:uncharacterized protein G2W53_021365 [Senna tora]|uniref:Uncharacterized protein n=1 Tax=Senna tora TaxID=362788 RepID=A0A834WL17_9FABA|nr:uncharacterized protein G2W53_021365 [Senna tora]
MRAIKDALMLGCTEILGPHKYSFFVSLTCFGSGQSGAKRKNLSLISPNAHEADYVDEIIHTWITKGKLDASFKIFSQWPKHYTILFLLLYSNLNLNSSLLTPTI